MIKTSEVIRVLKGGVVPSGRVILRGGDQERIGKIVNLFNDRDGGDITLKEIVKVSGLPEPTAVNVLAEMGMAKFVRCVGSDSRGEVFYEARPDNGEFLASCDEWNRQVYERCGKRGPNPFSYPGAPNQIRK
jgi:hypothetical protein